MELRIVFGHSEKHFRLNPRLEKSFACDFHKQMGGFQKIQIVLRLCVHFQAKRSFWRFQFNLKFNIQSFLIFFSPFTANQIHRTRSYIIDNVERSFASMSFQFVSEHFQTFVEDGIKCVNNIWREAWIQVFSVETPTFCCKYQN